MFGTYCVLCTHLPSGFVYGMGSKKTFEEAVTLLRSLERINRLYREGPAGSNLANYRIERVPGDGSVPDNLKHPAQREQFRRGDY